MIRLTIDSKNVEVAAGTTILEAARGVGIEIPTMCYLKQFRPSTSCMICVVKVSGRAGLVPSCGAPVQEGMEVITDSPRIRTARRVALELLLSDHVGDCMGPCQMGCPANMDIPSMIRQIGAGDMEGAIRTIKRDIALPAILGRICPAPCEKVCRRGGYDKAVAICLLKRYAADADLAGGRPFVPVCQAGNGRKVAIVGAGPAGLSCGFYLAQRGFKCVIFDDHEKPGGMLRYGIDRSRLPEEVLEKEIGIIFSCGARFKPKTTVGVDISIEGLREDFDAVFIAAGASDASVVRLFGPQTRGDAIKAEAGTYRTSVAGVFAGGDITGKRRLAIRSLADGKEAAAAIEQYLSGLPLTGAKKEFNVRMGTLDGAELELFMESADRGLRQEPSGSDAGFNDCQAVAQSMRCLHCDCRKADMCLLRRYSAGYQAKASRYKRQRRKFIRRLEHPEIIFEPGKCIHCGLCIQTAEAAGEELGLSFVGRGFDVRVAVAFDYSIADGLHRCAVQCARNCPTAAITLISKS